ncbi:MAG: MFS transporter [Novosphingobium sp.]|nr:MFS transporter [Novosphingobium sp.]
MATASKDASSAVAPARIVGQASTAAPTRYAWYVLLLLTAANTFNYIDRKILSILAEAIKADLGIDDAQIGFLFGTVFAALYAIFGLPIGRLADNWSRTRLMALGLTLWSGMTALSGFAGNFLHLSLARVGVSAGEAVANPCSHSLIADYFPAHRRATAYATYLTGSFVGMGLSLAIGGVVMQGWPSFAADVGLQWLRPWQAAFLICGLPGLVLALLVFRMVEPQRGALDGLPARPTVAKPWRALPVDIASVLPPFSFARMARMSPRALRINLIGAALLSFTAWFMLRLTGDVEQWIASALAAYAIMSFAQAIHHGDLPLFRLTFGSRAFQLLAAGMAVTACINTALLFWAPPHMLRHFGLSEAQAGLTLGLIIAGSTAVGVIGGGMIVDRIRRRDVRAAIWAAFFGLLGPAPMAAMMFLADDLGSFYIGLIGFCLLQNSWSGGAAAILQELVLPRMRATGSASFSMLIIVASLSLGPYAAGKISTLTGSLSTGALSLYVLAPVGVLLLWAAARRLPDAVAGKVARAEAAQAEMDRARA